MTSIRCAARDARHAMRGMLCSACDARHSYCILAFYISTKQQTFETMDIYQIASEYWDGAAIANDPSDPRETPPFDPRPEVPSPESPEETPPFEREPET